MPAMTLASALRVAHVRTAGQAHRACPCCISLAPRSKDAARARRAQRRRENAQLRAGREDY